MMIKSLNTKKKKKGTIKVLEENLFYSFVMGRAFLSKILQKHRNCRKPKKYDYLKLKVGQAKNKIRR